MDIFHCYGITEYLISDNGTQVKCKELENFLESLGHIFTAIYSPQANASERVILVINE